MIQLPNPLKCEMGQEWSVCGAASDKGRFGYRDWDGEDWRLSDTSDDETGQKCCNGLSLV